MVSDTLVEEIRSRADLVEICGEHTSLKRVGKSYRGPCPLHGGDGPNFSVDPARGIFKCFVCAEGGDVFSFVMKHLGMEFPEAVRHVGGKVGIAVPDREERREDPHAHLREVLAFAHEWFAERLRGEEGAAARRHLSERGFGLEEAEVHGLGYAPDAWRAFRDAAAARGIDERHLLELGLLATSERADEPYDRFRNRLTFSIFDLRDRPIGFGGRWLGTEGREVPKYINSPDSPVFHKGETLYGLNWARHAIRREGHAAIMEGYTDVLALHVRELPIAIAGLGTAFTATQAETLARYTDRAYLLYDSDRPGLQATFRTADVLLAAGVHAMVVTLPEGEDPDSLVRRRGVEALRRHMSDAVDVLERKLQILERRGYLDKVEGRRRAIDGLLSTLRAVKDPALRDIYLDRAAERTGVRRETLVEEVVRDAARLRRGERRRPATGASGAGRGRPAVAGPGSAERTVALLMLRDAMRPRGEREGSLVARARAAGLEPAHFRDEALAAIYDALIRPEAGEDETTGNHAAGGASGRPPEGPGWTRELEPDLLPVVEELVADDVELTHPGEIFEQSLRRVLHRPRLERLGEIDRALELAEEQQARELLREKQRLASELREAGVPLSFLRRTEAE